MFFLDTDDALGIAPAPLPNTRLMMPPPGVKPTFPVEINRVNGLPLASRYWPLQRCETRDLLASAEFEVVGSGDLTWGDSLGNSTIETTAANALYTGNAPIGSEAVTLILDLKNVVYSAWKTVAGWYNGATSSLLVSANGSTGTYYVYGRNTTSGDITVATSVPVGGDAVIAIVIDNLSGGRCDVYIDGEHVGFDIFGNSYANFSSDLYVGGNGGGSYIELGVECVSIFPEALSAELIACAYAAPYQFLKPKLDVLPIQSRNVPGGFSLPAQYELPDLLIQGRKPAGLVEIDWQQLGFIPRNLYLLQGDSRDSLLLNDGEDTAIIYNNAAIFNGTNSGIYLGRLTWTEGATALQVRCVFDYDGSGGYLVSQWGDSATNRQFMVSVGDSTARYLQFGVFKNGAKWIYKTVNGVVTDGKHAVVCTWKQGSLKAYMDGVELSLSVNVWTSGTMTSLSTAAIDGQHIGRNHTGSYYGGAIELVMLDDSFCDTESAKRWTLDPYQFLIPAGT